MKALVNSLLMGIFSLIMVLPMVVNHVVISLPSVGGRVAGVRELTEKEVNVIPNLSDFNGYASFKPEPIVDGVYKDLLGLQVFQRQRASYNGLYSVFNLTEDRELELEVRAGLPLQIATLEEARISVSDGRPSSQPLLADLEQGATLVKVSQPELFQEDENIWLGGELAKVVVISSDGLVVTPLRMSHRAGELIYNESIILRGNQLLNPRTRTVVIGPGQSVTVDAVVEGTADLLIGDQMLQIPLIFKTALR